MDTKSPKIVLVGNPNCGKSSLFNNLTKLKQKITNVPGTTIENKVGTVTRAQLEEVANIKMKDLNANDLDAAVQIVAGTARSMGLVVEG